MKIKIAYVILLAVVATAIIVSPLLVTIPPPSPPTTPRFVEFEAHPCQNVGNDVVCTIDDASGPGVTVYGYSSRVYWKIIH